MPATVTETRPSISASELVNTARWTPRDGAAGCGAAASAGAARPPFCAASDAASAVQSASDAAARGSAGGSAGADLVSDSLMLFPPCPCLAERAARRGVSGGAPHEGHDSRRSARQKPRAASVLAQPLPQLGELAPAHGPHVGLAAQAQRETVRRVLERLDVRDPDEQASVRAHEVARELLFRSAQRLVDELLAASVADGHVLLVRAKKADVRDQNQLEVVAHPHRHVLARRERLLRRRELLELRRAQSRRVLERLLEPLAPHRLEQIADGLRLEGLQRVLVVCRGEHDGRRLLERSEMARHLDAGEAGHADIEQHDRGLEPRDELQRLDTRRAAAGDAPARELADQPLDPLPGRQLVVDDQHAEGRAARRRVHTSYGKRIVTLKESAARSTSSAPSGPSATRPVIVTVPPRSRGSMPW